MIKKTPVHLVSLLMLLCFSWSAKGQALDHVQGEILIQFNTSVRPALWAKQGGLRAQSAPLTVDACLSEPLNIWSVRFDWVTVNELELLDRLRQDPQVQFAQFNHFISLRSTFPNDTLFAKQYFLHNTGQDGATPGLDLDMDKAWDLTTGGISPGGDTVVVCVIDNGVDDTHPDLRQNLWFNRAEIPNNGKDDDGNGYIDDFKGWNVDFKTDQINYLNFHGTPVAGIIGGRGNNTTGGTGINWRVKLMVVTSQIANVLTEARAIEAYTYPLVMRQRYNNTNGAEGAFVVATNASWGIDRRKPADFPIWCAFYNTLGEAGIVNVAATINEDIDVDVVGDIPTTCPSEYLITCTSLTEKGVQRYGYGVTSIDMAAFGFNLWTTSNGGGYRRETGNSFAAPQIAGAVGLLYAAGCPTLTVLAKTDPAEAARRVRRALVQGVVPQASLQGKTVTGGYLNINNSLRLLLDQCGSCPPLAQIKITNVTTTSAAVDWRLNDSIQRVDVRWRAVGTPAWTTLNSQGSPLVFTNLSSCTDYEVEFRRYCKTDTVTFEQRLTFRTDGCCEPPIGVEFQFIGLTDVLLKWKAVTAAESYTLRWRRRGSTDAWASTTAFGPSGGLRSLTACTEYEMQIRSDCPGGTASGYGPLVYFRTLGCGACLEKSYCTPRGLGPANTENEWIASIKINDFENKSSKEGYGDFTGLKTTTLKPGSPYVLRLEPGYAAGQYDEFFVVWIDLNQDGFFTTEEVVFNSQTARKGVVTSMVTIPATAKTGPTRMRVVMRYRQEGSACVFPADFFGEVEDYCLTISNVVSTQETLPLLGEAQLIPNPVTTTCRVALTLGESLPALRVRVWNASGQVIYQQPLGPQTAGPLQVEIPSTLWPLGVYFVGLESPRGRVVLRAVKANE